MHFTSLEEWFDNLCFIPFLYVLDLSCWVLAHFRAEGLAVSHSFLNHFYKDGSPHGKKPSDSIVTFQRPTFGSFSNIWRVTSWGSVLKGYRYHKKYVKSSTEFDFPILNSTHVEECLNQTVTKIKIKRLETLQIQTFIRCKIRTDAQFSFFVQCSSSCTTAKLIHKANTN